MTLWLLVAWGVLGRLISNPTSTWPSLHGIWLTGPASVRVHCCLGWLCIALGQTIQAVPIVVRVYWLHRLIWSKLPKTLSCTMYNFPRPNWPTSLYFCTTSPTDHVLHYVQLLLTSTKLLSLSCNAECNPFWKDHSTSPLSIIVLHSHIHKNLAYLANDTIYPFHRLHCK